VTDNGNDGQQDASGVDQKLRERLAREIATFNDALEAAVQAPTSKSLDSLAQAADRLMRAVGRVLIEAKRNAARP
jgi:hypothetical protein